MSLNFTGISKWLQMALNKATLHFWSVWKERLYIFFPQIRFYFREKRTFRFHPLESMNRVITGRKLNTFARFAFQRYYIKGNLTKVSSFIDSSSFVKWKLCRNWLLKNLIFHHVPLFRIPQNYVCKLLKEWSCYF